MEKLDYMIANYSQYLYPTMPEVIKKRVNALKKIQLEKLQLELDYHREVQALELKYAKLFEPFNERRFKIISGEHVPSDDECKLPEILAEETQNDENSFKLNELKLTKAEEKEIADAAKGIPSFWLCVLTSTGNFSDSIEDHDKEVLKFLTDIRVHYQTLENDVVIHTLEFLFDENPYFTNQVLLKKYHLKLTIDDKEPFAFDGHELFKIEGCTIDWKPGKDTTSQMKTVKQKNKNDGSIRVKSKSVECESFFHFFSPPPFPEPEDKEDQSGSAALASLDFELGEIIRQNLIPKAVLYFTGDLEDYDDENDDESLDESDEDDEEMSDEDRRKKKGAHDDDDSDVSEASDEHEDSEDSLSEKERKDKVKKVGMKLNNSHSKHSPKKSPGKNLIS